METLITNSIPKSISPLEKSGIKTRKQADLHYLVNNTNPFHPVSNQSKGEWKERLSHLHSQAIYLLQEDKRWRRLPDCGARPINYDGSVSLFETKDGWKYLNVYRCGMKAVCPRCANAETWRDKRDIRNAASNWTEYEDKGIYMVTYSASFEGSNLKDSLADLGDAYRRLHSGKGYCKLKKDYGIEAEIKGTEITYNNRSGEFHPHIHTLVFADKALDKSDMVNMETSLLHRWQNSLSGKATANEYGLDVKPSNIKNVSYICKGVRFSDDTEHLTVWDLLEASSKGDKEAGEAFTEYAGATYNKPLLFWSPRLKNRLVAKPKTFKGKNEKRQEIKPLARISASDWQAMKATGKDNDLEAILEDTEMLEAVAMASSRYDA